MNKLMIGVVLAVLVANVVFAADSPSLSSQLNSIKDQIKNIVPIVALVMIVLAGLVYAAGQVMGAEMRSRASVWATSLLVGAIIGLVIAASADGIIGLFSGAALVT